jgi:hypothetical protein
MPDKQDNLLEVLGEETSEEQLEVYLDDPVYCFACGNEIKGRKVSMLICLDCIDDDCNTFVERAEK